MVPSGTFAVLMDGAYGDTGRGAFRTMRSDCKHYVKLPTANHFGPINWNSDTQGAPQARFLYQPWLSPVNILCHRRRHALPLCTLVTTPISRLPSLRKTSCLQSLPASPVGLPGQPCSMTQQRRQHWYRCCRLMGWAIQSSRPPAWGYEVVAGVAGPTLELWVQAYVKFCRIAGKRSEFIAARIVGPIRYC